MKRPFLPFAIGVGLLSGVFISSCAVLQTEQSPIPDSLAASSDSTSTPHTIQRCPRQFTGWTLLRSFETAHYALALCQQDNVLYLVGHKKGEHEAFIDAPARIEDDRILAEDDPFSYEIRQGTFTIKLNGTITVQEGVS